MPQAHSMPPYPAEESRRASAAKLTPLATRARNPAPLGEGPSTWLVRFSIVRPRTPPSPTRTFEPEPKMNTGSPAFRVRE